MFDKANLELLRKMALWNRTQITDRDHSPTSGPDPPSR